MQFEFYVCCRLQNARWILVGHVFFLEQNVSLYIRKLHRFKGMMYPNHQNKADMTTKHPIPAVQSVITHTNTNSKG